jgi:carboxymethylenebutenolidase
MPCNCPAAIFIFLCGLDGIFSYMNKYILGALALIVLGVVGYWFFTGSSYDSEKIVPTTQMPLTTKAETVSYVSGVNGYLAQPETPGQYPGVVMIHENRGLRDEVKKAADDLAKEGYIVLAVDLFKGKVVETQEQAGSLTSTFDQSEGVANMKAAAQYLRSLGATKIASWGWCFGGKQSIELAISGETLDATVAYYGGGMATTTTKLAPIDWPVMGVFGDADRVISTSTREAFEDSLNTLGIENEIYVYPGVGHAFANPSNANHAPAETADAWAKTVAFLNKHLK